MYALLRPVSSDQTPESSVRSSSEHADAYQQFKSVSVLLRGATNRLVLVTTANWMYHEFLLNFYCNLRVQGVSYQPIVFSLDLNIHNFSRSLGLSSFLLDNATGDDVLPGRFERNGPRSFNMITKNKLRAVRRVLIAGEDVLMSDADIYWCADAMQKLVDLLVKDPSYANADVLIQPEANFRALNSGFYFVRSNPRTLALFDGLVENIELGAHDQDVVNKVFCDPAFGGEKILGTYGDDIPWHCVSRSAVIRLLPPQRFPSGDERYHEARIFSQSREKLFEMCSNQEIIVVHNNFIRATKKKARFVQKGMWLANTDKKEDPNCEETAAAANPTARRTCGTYCE